VWGLRGVCLFVLLLLPPSQGPDPATTPNTPPPDAPHPPPIGGFFLFFVAPPHHPFFSVYPCVFVFFLCYPPPQTRTRLCTPTHLSLLRVFCVLFFCFYFMLCVFVRLRVYYSLPLFLAAPSRPTHCSFTLVVCLLLLLLSCIDPHPCPRLFVYSFFVMFNVVGFLFFLCIWLM